MDTEASSVFYKSSRNDLTCATDIDAPEIKPGTRISSRAVSHSSRSPAGSLNASKHAGHEQKRPRLLAPRTAQLSREAPAEAAQSNKRTTAVSQSQFTNQKTSHRYVEHVRPQRSNDQRSIELQEPDEARSGQPSGRSRTAWESTSDEFNTRSRARRQACGTAASIWKYAANDSHYEDEINVYDDNYNNEERSEGRDSEYEEEDELVEDVRAQNCDWGTSGESGKVDSDRRTAEDRLLLEEEEEAAAGYAGNRYSIQNLDEDADEARSKHTSNNEIGPIIEKQDFCQNSEEENEAIQQQLRLSQRSSDQANRRMKNGRKLALHQHSAAQGKTHTTKSDVQDTYHHARPVEARRGKRMVVYVEGQCSSYPDRGSLRPPTSQRGERFIKSPSFKHSCPKGPWFGSPEFDDPVQLSNRANNSSNQSAQGHVNAQHSTRQRRAAKECAPSAAEKEKQRARNRWEATQSVAWEAEHGAGRVVTGNPGEEADHEDSPIATVSTSRGFEPGRGMSGMGAETDSDSDSESERDSQNGSANGSRKMAQAQNLGSRTSSSSSSESSRNALI